MRDFYLNQLQHYKFQNGHLEYLCIQDNGENENIANIISNDNNHLT